jgi:hypothetical protein
MVYKHPSGAFVPGDSSRLSEIIRRSRSTPRQVDTSTCASDTTGQAQTTSRKRARPEEPSASQATPKKRARRKVPVSSSSGQTISPNPISAPLPGPVPIPYPSPVPTPYHTAFPHPHGAYYPQHPGFSPLLLSSDSPNTSSSSSSMLESPVSFTPSGLPYCGEAQSADPFGDLQIRGYVTDSSVEEELEWQEQRKEEEQEEQRQRQEERQRRQEQERKDQQEHESLIQYIRDVYKAINNNQPLPKRRVC